MQWRGELTFECLTMHAACLPVCSAPLRWFSLSRHALPTHYATQGDRHVRTRPVHSQMSNHLRIFTPEVQRKYPLRFSLSALVWEARGVVLLWQGGDKSLHGKRRHVGGPRTGATLSGLSSSPAFGWVLRRRRRPDGGRRRAPAGNHPTRPLPTSLIPTLSLTLCRG